MVAEACRIGYPDTKARANRLVWQDNGITTLAKVTFIAVIDVRYRIDGVGWIATIHELMKDLRIDYGDRIVVVKGHQIAVYEFDDNWRWGG